MTVQLYCKKCGYSLVPKRPCMWCTSKHDALENFKGEDIVRMHSRFSAFTVKARVHFVIAMGLEGFTPTEISCITNASPEWILEVLEQAQVCRSC